jgi:hypothetical protein
MNDVINTKLFTIASDYLEGPVLQGGEEFTLLELRELILAEICDFNVQEEKLTPHIEKIDTLEVGESHVITHEEEFMVDDLMSDEMEEEIFTITVTRKQ